MNTVDKEPLYRSLLKATALGEQDEIVRLNEQRLSLDRSEADRERFRALVAALFCIAVEHRFNEDRSREAVTRFIDEMRYDYRNAEPPIKPFVTEGLVRAVLGEDDLLDDIPAEDQLEAQFPVIRKITMQSNDMSNRIDDYLKDADTLAQQWLSDS